uniref:Leucine-rich repeat-containing N-terminal plant-type domain-containing protein n=1 Tax=Tetradesmus obliquus TaxID=3088 RepID=A0A383W3C7_TETOB|eukprot:jgi/Sobl393_1/15578/SZX71710.1
MALRSLSWLILLVLTAAAAAVVKAQAVAPAGELQVLLAIARALDPTGKALPQWRSNNTKNWCKQWLAEQGCNSEDGTLSSLYITQAGLKAAAPLQGTLPQQLPLLGRPLSLFQVQISGPGITGTLPPWVLQVAYTLEVTNTSIKGPLPPLPAAAAAQRKSLAWEVQITGNPKLSGTLPPSWGSALTLGTLDLSSNALTGTIPDAWSAASFERINLAGNKLAGSISRAWARSLGSSSLALLNVSGNAGMKGCLADAKGQPWESLPFVDARGTPLLDCIKRQPALTQFGTPQAGWSAGSCIVAGYAFQRRQLPAELEWQQEPDQRVLLYTIQPQNISAKTPSPLATLAETAAACDALDACVMFTSDGYLIGAYRPVEDVKVLTKLLEIEKRLGPWQWRAMRYCSGKCCGTWVSTGFDAASLAVAAVNQSQVQAGGSTKASSAPPSGESALHDAYYSVDPSSERCAAMRAGDASGFTCPPRCRVACCAKEDAPHDLVSLSSHHFWQCSVQACLRSCGFQLIKAQAVSGPYTPKTVALYLAQKSKGMPAKTAGTSKSGGSKGCTGSLC